MNVIGSDKPRIVIATPSRGGVVTMQYHASCWAFMGSNVGIIDPMIMVDDDIVRARSRAVRLFLQTPGEYLLFWDGDVEGNPEALKGMLASGRRCIGAGYPKKVLDSLGRCVHLAVYTSDQMIPATEIVEVDAIGMGFMLLHRSLLETMVYSLDPELYFYDGLDRTVGLFKMIRSEDHTGTMRLWPEDYSFCKRVALFDKVCLYRGRGAPLGHVGDHTFRYDSQPYNYGPTSWPPKEG